MFRFLHKTFLTVLFVAFASQASAMFIQPDWLDPTQQGVGPNRYAYSGNDPINNYDANGNLFKELGAFFGGIVDGFSQTVTTGGLIPGYQPTADAGIAAGAQLDAMLGLGSSVLSQENHTPGIGHNGGPEFGDDQDSSAQGPNDPDPTGATLAAIAAVVGSQTGTKSPTPSGVTVSQVEGNLVQITLQTPNGQVDALAEVTISNGNLTLDSFTVYGPGANSIGTSTMRSAAKELGAKFGVDSVTVRGTPRVSGANPGKIPEFTIPVN